jgi:hypothetical protein
MAGLKTGSGMKVIDTEPDELMVAELGSVARPDAL